MSAAGTAARGTWLEAIRRDDADGPAVTAAGNVITAWTYKPRDGMRIADGGASFGGISPVGPAVVACELARHGHVVLGDSVSRPAAHHVIGCGVGHDDARFAESGESHAAWCESGEAYGGPWWEWPAERLARHFGLPVPARKPRKVASRHWCPNRDRTGHASFHTAGPGKPRGYGRCRYCGTGLVTETGLWCVMVHRGDGRYRLADALSTHLSEPAAERACTAACDAARAEHGYGAPETCVVVRWIPCDA